MVRILIGAMFSIVVFGSTLALAAEQTVKLSVPGMYCASCPYMVKKAISAVQGVKAVQAEIEDRSATVKFDDVVTNTAAIRKATADIGYPSTVIVAGGS